MAAVVLVVVRGVLKELHRMVVPPFPVPSPADRRVSTLDGKKSGILFFILVFEARHQLATSISQLDTLHT